MKLPSAFLISLLTAACASAPAPLERFSSGPEGFDTHSYWYDTGEEVIVFDAQFTEPLAEQLIQSIQKKTSSPIRWVVLTHPNPDKFNGVGPFRKLGAQVVASEATKAAIPGVHAYKKYYFVEMAKMFTAESYPPEAVVDQTFSGEWALVPGQVILYELKNSGVSTNQVVAYLPTTGDLVVGDLVHGRAHLWLEGGIRDGKPDPNLTNWKASLDELAQFSARKVHGGRGESLLTAEAIQTTKTYLDTAERLVKEYITQKDAATLIQGGAQADHQILKANFEAAFPGYGLSYLVEYGVYGLLGRAATLAR